MLGKFQNLTSPARALTHSPFPIAPHLLAALKIAPMCDCPEYKLDQIAAAKSGWNAVGPLIRAKHEELAEMREAANIAAPQNALQQTAEASDANGKSFSASVLGTALSVQLENEEGASDTPGDLTEEQQKMVQELKARDREVRAHEQAHAIVGGQYAGAPSYTYQSGPDGQQYAIGGEVSIDISPVDGDPEATIEKMQVVVAAALAPAEPSAQDRKVASIAQSQQAQAIADLMRLRADERSGEGFDQTY